MTCRNIERATTILIPIPSQTLAPRFLETDSHHSVLVCGLAAGWENLLQAQQQPAPRYDLIVKGGRVIDPSQSISAMRDIAVSGTKIARVAADIPAKKRDMCSMPRARS